MIKLFKRAYLWAQAIANAVGIWQAVFGFSAVALLTAAVAQMRSPFADQGWDWVETTIIAIGSGMLFVSFLSLCVIGLAAAKFLRAPKPVDRSDEVLAALSLMREFSAADRNVLFDIKDQVDRLVEKKK